MFSFKKIVLAAGAIGLLSMPALASPEINKAAPAFSAQDAHGKTVNLSDYKGSTVILEWSNHDCPFVKKHYESGNMQEVQKRAHADGVKWIKILSSASGRQGHVTDKQALDIADQDGSIVTTIIRDENGEIGHLYDAKTTPHMFIVNKNGILVYKGAIDSNSSPRPSTIDGAENYVIAALDALKSGVDIATAQTQPYGCGVKY